VPSKFVSPEEDQIMKRALIYAFLSFCIFANVSIVFAQHAARRAEELRMQLVEVQAKEAALQARRQQLEDDMKPENIERSLAGIGSVHPEELREQRRRQLELEKNGVDAQLQVLAESRANLEAAIVRADGEAYQESAQGNASNLFQVVQGQYTRAPGWLLILFGAVIGSLITTGAFLIIRRL
jgi:hypothetical protein